jgi:hypothetical protein
MTADRPHFPPTGYAVRVDGAGWRAWHDSPFWRGEWCSCYRDALKDALAHAAPVSGYAGRRAERGG